MRVSVCMLVCVRARESSHTPLTFHSESITSAHFIRSTFLRVPRKIVEIVRTKYLEVNIGVVCFPAQHQLRSEV